MSGLNNSYSNTYVQRLSWKKYRDVKGNLEINKFLSRQGIHHLTTEGGLFSPCWLSVIGSGCLETATGGMIAG
jgi:hypothetical protein